WSAIARVTGSDWVSTGPRSSPPALTPSSRRVWASPSSPASIGPASGGRGSRTSSRSPPTGTARSTPGSGACGCSANEHPRRPQHAVDLDGDHYPLRVRGGHPVAQPVPAFRLAARVIVGEHPHRPLEGEPAPTVDVGDRGAAAPFGVARLLGPPPGDHAGQS